MRVAVTFILAITLGANGLWMLAAPAGWYWVIPGAAESGPANLHFIRDVGCAYLIVALSLLWFGKAPRRAWPAALASGGFLAFHGVVHLWDSLSGRESFKQLGKDLPTIFLPAILVLWLAWSGRRAALTG